MKNTAKNEDLEFAYAMGLKRKVKDTEEENDALGFAYAMGLRRYRDGLETIEKEPRLRRKVSSPRFA